MHQDNNAWFLPSVDDAVIKRHKKYLIFGSLNVRNFTIITMNIKIKFHIGVVTGTATLVTLFYFFILFYILLSISYLGWSGGGMDLGKLPVSGHPHLDDSRERVYCACSRGEYGLWGCLDIFTLLYPFFLLSPSL